MAVGKQEKKIKNHYIYIYTLSLFSLQTPHLFQNTVLIPFISSSSRTHPISWFYQLYFSEPCPALLWLLLTELWKSQQKQKIVLCEGEINITNGCQAVEWHLKYQRILDSSIKIGFQPHLCSYSHVNYVTSQSRDVAPCLLCNIYDHQDHKYKQTLCKLKILSCLI